MSNQKKSYTKPELNVHGNVEALTQSNGIGTKLDMTFQEGADISEVTVGS